MTSSTFSRLASVLAPALVATLVACGGAQQPATTPATTEAAATVVPPPAAGSAATGAPAAALPKTPGPNLTPDGVVFNFRAEGKGKRIFLAGNFNGWNPSDEKFLMKDDDGDSIWTITVKLAPGSYQYKYVVDGQWTKDPYSPGDAPDGYGGRNGQFDVK